MELFLCFLQFAFKILNSVYALYFDMVIFISCISQCVGVKLFFSSQMAGSNSTVAAKKAVFSCNFLFI